MMENYRTIHATSEIISLIQNANCDNLGQVWQTQGPLRQTYQIMELATDVDHCAIILETQSAFEFNRDYPVYVRISEKNLIFKLDKKFLIKKNRLICPIPTEAKAMELRTSERFKIPSHKMVQLKLKPLETSALEVSVKLQNFSHKGMGVQVPVVNQDYFERVPTFSIQSISGIKIGERKTLTVRHVGKSAVGFCVNEPFDNGTFTYLQNFLL